MTYRLTRNSVQNSTVRNNFLVRFYRWSTADTLLQFGQGFPRLQRLPSGPAMKYLEFLDGLPRRDRKRFVLAKLKKTHLKAVAALHESISPADESLLRAFYRGQTVKMSPEFGAYVRSSSEMKVNELKILEPETYRIDKSQLLAKAEARLRSILGEPKHAAGHSRMLEFETLLGDWSITTTVETPQTFQLRYSFTIGSKRRAPLLSRASAFSWMGVGKETYWNYLTKSDLDAAADWLFETCRVLLDALPGMLKALNHREAVRRK